MAMRRAAVRLQGRACAFAFVAALLAEGTAGAQTTIALPDTSETTTLTAAVAEQARVTVPAGISFAVTDVNVSTAQGNVGITVQNIVLATATKQLRISLIGNAASFTPPVAGAATWSADDVSWTAGPGGGPNAWQNAIGSAGVLTSAAYTTIATCNPDASSCSIAKLTFSLAPKPSVKRSGAHTLTVTWRFESIGT
jgi:hypothetical protein